MKKKFMALMLMLCIVFQFVGCSKTCKEDGCDNEVFKEGYCQVHYYVHNPEEALKDGAKIINGLMN